MTIAVGSAAEYAKRKQDELTGSMTPSYSMVAKVDTAPNQPTNINPAPIAPAKTVAPSPEPFRSVAGDNVTSYIDGVSAKLGQDPGYTTEAGRLAAERTTNGLKTPDASSVNVQNTEDTNAARRAYLARMQADESIGQSGFGAGTAQADRIRSNATAGVNAANQAGQSSANAYLRQRTEDNLNRAQSLENTQYGKGRDNLADAERSDLNQYGRSEKATDRGLAAAAVTYSQGRDAVGDKRYDAATEYSQGRDAKGDARTAEQDRIANEQRILANTRTDRLDTNAETQQGVVNAQWATLNQQQQAQLAIENATVASGKDDAAKRNLLAGLPEGPAKNKVMAGLADGSLTVANALAAVMNPDGTIKDEYAGKTPGSLGLEAEKEYAQQTVDLQDPTLKTSDPQAYLAKVNAEMLANREAKNEPINQAKEGATLDAARKSLATGGTLDQKQIDALKTSGDIAPYEVNSLPTGSDAQAIVGKTVSVGGDVYKVTKADYSRTGWSGGYAGDPRHTDWTELTALDGTKKYVYDGAIHDSEPKKV